MAHGKHSKRAWQNPTCQVLLQQPVHFTGYYFAPVAVQSTAVTLVYMSQ